ncbi:hypothetical protein SNEBB_004260 [Seison nebaliae]|nr:hypothetical protein SNEBB_004260 [Seison nebaliae]
MISDQSIMSIKEKCFKGKFHRSSDIEVVEDSSLNNNQYRIKLKKYSKSKQFIQFFKPLQYNHQYSVNVISTTKFGDITIGAASKDFSSKINENADLEIPEVGKFNRTVGYQCSTGKIFSSSSDATNCIPVNCTIGDSIDILNIYQKNEFAQLLFLKNGHQINLTYVNRLDGDDDLYPVLTLYGDETEVAVSETFVMTKKFKFNNTSDWIKSPTVDYNSEEKLFSAKSSIDKNLVCSSMTIGDTDLCYYELKITRTKEQDNHLAIAGVTTCSPILPSPAITIFQDFFTYQPTEKLSCGDRMGWGTYTKGCRQTSETWINENNLIILFNTINGNIDKTFAVVQPPGGFFAVIMLKNTSIQLSFDDENLSKDLLAKHWERQMLPAKSILKNNLNLRLPDTSEALEKKILKEFIKSPKLNLEIKETKIIASLNDITPNTNHYLQLIKFPLSIEYGSSFLVEIDSLTSYATVIIGVTTKLTNLNSSIVGYQQNSVGYNSIDGKIWYNGKCGANLEGIPFVQGDSIIIQVLHFEKTMSVLLFVRNLKPVATRFITHDPEHPFIYPTIYFTSSEINSKCRLVIYSHYQMTRTTYFDISEPENWCLPYGTKCVHSKNQIVPNSLNINLTNDQKQNKNETYVNNDLIYIYTFNEDLTNDKISMKKSSYAIQAPQSLNQKTNHFEMIIADDFGEQSPPCVIALCTASPYDDSFDKINRPKYFSYRQDFIRFWPISLNSQEKTIKKGDRVGWGIIFPKNYRKDSEGNSININELDEEDRLVICFLTINRNIGSARVLLEPPGGFFPVIISPQGNRVAIDLSATSVTSFPYQEEEINRIINAARKEIVDEKLYNFELEKELAYGENESINNNGRRLKKIKSSKACTIL